MQHRSAMARLLSVRSKLAGSPVVRPANSQIPTHRLAATASPPVGCIPSGLAVAAARSAPPPAPEPPLASAASVAAVAAFAAGVGVAAADEAPLPTLPAQSLTATLGLDKWAALVADVRGGDSFSQMRAVESLLVAANDIENHPDLIKAGAVGALVEAYSRGGNGDAGEARNVGIMRALAELARTEEAHTAFREADAAGVVGHVVLDVVCDRGWFDRYVRWIWRMLGLGGRDGLWEVGAGGKDSKGNRRRLDQDPALATDILAIEDQHGTVANVDIRGGLVYHGTRCIANLAKATTTHEWLLKSEVLSAMVSLLNGVPMGKISGAASLADVVGDEQLADTVRFAALSVAALAKSAPEIVIEKKGHVPLIALLGQEVDSVAQTYAAGGVRNLTRHSSEEKGQTWDIHRQLVVDGLVPALCLSLSNASSPQTQIFSALAVGDVMATGHAKSSVICKRMFAVCGPFASLLTSGNVGVARACHRALEQIFSGEADHRGLTLSSDGVKKYTDLAEAVAEHVGPLVRGGAAKGDPVAMRAVAALSLSEVMSDSLVRKGIVSTLVAALAAKTEFGEQAMVALARITGRPEHMAEILLRGGIKAIMQRRPEDGRWESAALANMARAERNRPDIGHGGLHIFLRAAHSKSDEARIEGARGLFNLTIGGVSRVLSAQGGALVPLTKIAATMEGEARRYAVGAIAAISELYAFDAKIVELHGIAVLLRAVAADKTLTRDVARVFAQLSNHVESHKALAKQGAAAWLVSTVARGDAAADTLFHAAAALCNIAYTSGAPHDALREAGAISALTGLASGLYQPHVSQCARIALASIRGGATPVLQHADSHGPVDPA